MKPVEEAFASGSFRQVILPGIILIVGIHPLVSGWATQLERLYGFSSTVFLVAELIAFGLVISSGIQWIYYVYEGFRLPWLTAWAGRRNQITVDQLPKQIKNVQQGRKFEQLTKSEQTRIFRLNEHLLDFPLRREEDGSIKRFAERPTRLGNIIANYELYAETRYGINGVFYWYHLLNLAPSDIRKEFQDKYSFAESLVVTSFSGVIVALLHSFVLLGFAIGAVYPTLVFVRISIGPLTSAGFVLIGVFVWWAFYLASFSAHRQAGAIFRSMIDKVIPDFMRWTTEMKQAALNRDSAWESALTEYLKKLKQFNL